MLRVRVGIAVMGAGMVLSVIAAEMLVEHHFAALGVLFGAAVLLIFIGAILVARAGTPDERNERQARLDRWGAALGMALGKASGGWTPPQHDRTPPQRRNHTP